MSRPGPPPAGGAGRGGRKGGRGREGRTTKGDERADARRPRGVLNPSAEGGVRERRRLASRVSGEGHAAEAPKSRWVPRPLGEGLGSGTELRGGWLAGDWEGRYDSTSESGCRPGRGN